MKEAYSDLEHSSPFRSLLEIEQNKISENPHDSPGILKDYKCPYQLSARRKRPRKEQGPSVPQTVAAATPQTSSCSSLENTCLNR